VRALLTFESETAGISILGKARGIRERFGVTPTAYAQALVFAIDDPESLLIAPMLVARLRRLRDRRRELRTVRRSR
jgi:hypothetical protein